MLQHGRMDAPAAAPAAAAAVAAAADAAVAAAADADADAEAACKFCRSSVRVADGICDACERRWLVEVGRIAPECGDDTPIADLFRRADASVRAQMALDEKLREGGPVPVYLYGFGQDVRYVVLGELAVEGEGAGGRRSTMHYTVVCTLDCGGGGLRRAGLHRIVAHDLNTTAEGSLPVDDAAEIVASAVRRFAHSDAHSAEVLQVADRFLKGASPL